MPKDQTACGPVEYRLEGHGDKVALVFPGGHMSSALRLGEDCILDAGYRVLSISRPGYGGTPLRTGRTPEQFADAVSDLCKRLGISRAITVGISAGGRSAISLAIKYPALAERLILQSSVSFMPWPDTKTRVAAYIAFNPVFQAGTWWTMRLLLRRWPRPSVQLLVANMTTLDASQVVNGCSDEELHQLTEVFKQLSSGHGFLNDIRRPHGDASGVTVPTLIIHSKYDKSVPLSHPRVLAQQIKNSHLELTAAESHMIWFSSHYSTIEKTINSFLNEAPQ